MTDYPSGSKIFGRFEVAGNPLMGGMGIVYLCEDLQENRPVALKTFQPQFLPDRETRAQFLRECTAWVELGQHPNIVRCYEIQSERLETFLVLELIAKEQGREGASLRDWIRPGYPLPVDQALLFLLQIAHGMKHAVREIPGFVHRDLKPENILIGADRLPGTKLNRVRVTDFGLARFIESQSQSAVQKVKAIGGKIYPGQTQSSNNMVGTSLYMAPEQWRNGEVGNFTDIYALGCIFYELLTGYFAIDENDISDDSKIARAHCEGRLHSFPGGTHPYLVKLLQFFTATDPGKRVSDWSTAEDLLSKVYYKLTNLPNPLIVVEKTSVSEGFSDGWPYNTIGAAYMEIGKVEEASVHFKKALVLARKAKDRSGEGTSLVNLGSTYAVLGNQQQAITYYEQGLVINREIANRRGEGDTLNNLGGGL